MKRTIILFFTGLFFCGKIFCQFSSVESNNILLASEPTVTHSAPVAGEHEHSEEPPQNHGASGVGEAGHTGTDSHGEHAPFDPKSTAFHHISDLNVFSIGSWNLPLPCILYAPGYGWSVFSSGKFGIDNAHHGNGHLAIDGYVLNHGRVNRISGEFPRGTVEVEAIFSSSDKQSGAHEKDSVRIAGIHYGLDKPSTADAGLFGGGITSFYDFSLTKNAVSMLLVILLLSWAFLSMARSYRKAPGTAPRGAQLLFEPIILFIQDEVAKPFLGRQWERFMPLLLALFFFILGLNLFGQIPFLGGSNVTGNLSVTMVLAVIAFIVVNTNGNRHYWEHVFWMPGVPAWVKTILTPVEVLGVFIKPLTLMLRLFANITAGHMAILIFISLIFIFGQSGANTGAGLGASLGSGLLTIFMMSIELLVAVIQAFVFTLLTACYIGAAIEDHHHAAEEHHG